MSIFDLVKNVLYFFESTRKTDATFTFGGFHRMAMGNRPSIAQQKSSPYTVTGFAFNGLLFRQDIRWKEYMK